MTWIKTADDMVTFSRFCGPTSLANLMECSRFDAAEMLAAVPGMVGTSRGAVCGYIWVVWLERDLGLVKVDVDMLPCGVAANERYLDQMDRYHDCYRNTRPSWATRRPTWAAARRDLPKDWSGIVMTTQHTFYVHEGTSMDNLRTGSTRARVNALLTLPK